MKKRVGSFLLAITMAVVSIPITARAETIGWVIPPQFEEVGQFSEGLAIAYVEDHMFGFIDKTGAFVIAPTLGGDVQVHYKSGVDAMSGGRFTYMDAGEPIFKDGIVNVYKGNVFYEPIGSTDQYHSWGYMDKNGNMLVDFQYARTLPFSDGLGLVFDLDEGSSLYEGGIINRQGNVVFTPASVKNWDNLGYDGSFITFFNHANNFHFNGKVVLSVSTDYYYDPAYCLIADLDGNILYTGNWLEFLDDGRILETYHENGQFWVKIMDSNFNELKKFSCGPSGGGDNGYSLLSIESGLYSYFSYFDEDYGTHIYNLEGEHIFSITDDVTAVYYTEGIAIKNIYQREITSYLLDTKGNTIANLSDYGMSTNSSNSTTYKPSSEGLIPAYDQGRKQWGFIANPLAGQPAAPQETTLNQSTFRIRNGQLLEKGSIRTDFYIRNNTSNHDTSRFALVIYTTGKGSMELHPLPVADLKPGEVTVGSFYTGFEWITGILDGQFTSVEAKLIEFTSDEEMQKAINSAPRSNNPGASDYLLDYEKGMDWLTTLAAQ